MKSQCIQTLIATIIISYNTKQYHDYFKKFDKKIKHFQCLASFYAYSTVKLPDKLSVKVGSVDHPMEEKHYIEWIFVETENGGQRKVLNPGDAPKAEFSFAGDKPVAVYAYCNLHGLWKAEI